MQVSLNVPKKQAIVTINTAHEARRYLKMVHMATSLYYQDIVVPEVARARYANFLDMLPDSKIIGLPNVDVICGTYWLCAPVSILYVNIENILAQYAVRDSMILLHV